MRVDLESDPLLLRRVFEVFIHTSGTEPIFYSAVLGPCGGGVRVPVFDLQMNGLILLVVGAGAANTGQNIKTDLAVRLWVFDLVALRSQLRRRRIGGVVLECPWSLAAENERLQTGVHNTTIQAKRGAK